ncbi:head GIN domain-containing protein [Flavisphingomonas formosensis]|uniref:head GIN domain-containing protein n=1 Tax=Flavisphingomonas formosensis TaxID=861534 RepID=UPI0012F97493|nr:head GIN domain-containing protein [Sphingomonas formosensis]
MVRRLLFLALAICTAARGEAAQRTYSVTSFDRIRVEGPYVLDVRTGSSPSARAVGDAVGIDRLSIEVQGTTLIVRPDKSDWSGWPGASSGPVRIAVSTPSLSAVSLNGAPTVSIDRMKGSALDLQLIGSGSLSVGMIDSDSLTAMASGAGSLSVAGRVKTAKVALQGAGRLDASQLSAADVEVTALGNGDITIGAQRSARINAAGSGNVTISGQGSCIVRQSGAGVVSCAHRQAD